MIPEYKAVQVPAVPTVERPHTQSVNDHFLPFDVLVVLCLSELSVSKLINTAPTRAPLFLDAL